MRISRRRLGAALLATAILVTPAVAADAGAALAAGSDGLTTRVSIDTVSSDSLSVRFTVRNDSPSTIAVLSRDLPQATPDGAALSVTRDGTPVPYLGRMIKYAPPTAADYTTIPAGGSYTVTADLAGHYDLSQPGTYRVGLADGQVRIARGTAPMKVDVATIRTPTAIRGSARTPAAESAAATVRTSIAAVTLEFRGCSTSQMSQLRTAVADAAVYSASAGRWLAANPSGGGLYRTWFGAHSSSRFSHVTSVFSKISTQLTGRTVTLDCTRPENYMAFVYANEPYVIYICRGYWPAAPTGYDSKAGTLIHESSHFTVNGGAKDWIYGLEEGKRLAVSDPAKAVTNADNLEHFAESL